MTITLVIRSKNHKSTLRIHQLARAGYRLYA